MLEEFNNDVKHDTYCKSVSLKREKHDKYVEAMREAIMTGTEKTLETAIISQAMFSDVYIDKNGNERKTARRSEERYAGTEFNKYYVRGICRKAISDGVNSVVVYRARHSSMPNPKSEEMIGEKIRAQELLNDVRANTETSPELLPHVNSGLSVKI